MTTLVRSSPATVLVVGAGYAGVLAAGRVARLAGPRARVTLLDPSLVFVERIRLHEVAAGRAPSVRPVSEILAGTGVSLRRGRALAIDVARRAVVLDEDGTRTRLEVDALVLAAGSRTAADVPGARTHAHRLDDVESARALGRAARACRERGQPLVVVGGGLTAIEAATELAEALPGLRIRLLSRGALGEPALGAAAVGHVCRALGARAIEVEEHTAVTHLEAERVHTTRGVRAAGAVSWCAGFSASPLAAAAGLAVDPSGRLLTDETLAAAAPWIWGAGDAAVPAQPVGAPIDMACKTAVPMAAHAADNLVRSIRGEAPVPFRFGDTGVCVSLGRRDAVIQRRRADGAPAGIVRGRAGALVKEAVCRFAGGIAGAPALQALLAPYAWRGARVVRAGHPALAAASLP